MEKNVIEVVLQPEAKQESILFLLFKKKKFLLLITLIGLIIGLVVSSVYYLRESKRMTEASTVQPTNIIPVSLYNRQFLTQPTREREPGNLHIYEQLRYDIFLVNKTMTDIILDLSQNNQTALKTSFEAFQNLITKKIALINEFTVQPLSINIDIFTTNIDDYIAKYPYLMINDDKEVIKAKVLDNQAVIDFYKTAAMNVTDSTASAQILLDIESLNKENKVLEEIIQGNTANDPDPRGTQIAAAQIDVFCETLDEVKSELLTMIDKYASVTNSYPAPSLLKVIAIGAIFPCMMFVAATLLVVLLDWWRKFIAEHGKTTRSDN